MVCVLVLLCGVFISFSASQAQEIAEKQCDNYNTALTTFNGSLLGTLLMLDFHEGAEEQSPHMAALGYVEHEGAKWKLTWACGGSLISDNYILTVAHCLNTRLKGPVRFVRLGSKHLSYDGQGEIVEVEKTIHHPDYKHPSTYNDIGLIKLKRSVIFSQSILPACLNTMENFTQGAQQSAKLVNVGWGPTEFGGETMDTVWNAEMQYSTHEKCQNAYQIEPKTFASGVNFSVQFCAHQTAKHPIPCYVMTGSPMHLKEKGRLSTLVGVTSFGKTCDYEATPGVYGRVSAYVPWIESIVWE